jgi:ABC-type dipeptide/oligopeptide/nickel transport system ATPase subunit
MKVEKISDLKVVKMSNHDEQPADIPHPCFNFSNRSNMNMAIIAPTGSGKSNLMAFLLHSVYRHVFSKIYICSSNVHENRLNDHAYDFLKFDETRLFDTINNEICEYIKMDIETDEDKNDGAKYLLIIDDLTHEINSNSQRSLFALFTKGRHINLSIWVISHKYVFLKRIIRNNLTHMIIFHTSSESEIETIYKDSIDIKKNKFLEIYRYATKEPHNFLYIDMTKNPKQFYKNFEEQLSV